MNVAARDVIRGELEDSSAVSSGRIRDMSSAGYLLPDFVMNDLMTKRIASIVSASAVPSLILDGYPRTVAQAEYVRSILPPSVRVVAVHIQLERTVAVEKTLARRKCRTCGDDFNIAHIVRDGFVMPAILPDNATCRLGADKCFPELTSRADDTKETIERRIAEQEVQAAPLLEYYERVNSLHTFTVKRGIADTDYLIQLLAIEEEV